MGDGPCIGKVLGTKNAASNSLTFQSLAALFIGRWESNQSNKYIKQHDFFIIQKQNKPQKHTNKTSPHSAEPKQRKPDIIEHQLAHAVRDANGRAYNRTSFLKDRRQIMQQID